MDENQARTIAEALGGETWQSGANIWLVVFRRSDGKVVAVSDEVVCEYRDEATLESGRPDASITLR